jgi:hypothetical protein
MDKELNPDDSVRNEQFGAEQNASENAEEKKEQESVQEDTPDTGTTDDASGETTGNEQDDAGKEKESGVAEEANDQDADSEEITSDSEVVDEGEDEIEEDPEPEDELVDNIIETPVQSDEKAEEESDGDSQREDASNVVNDDKYKEVTLPPVDYSSFGKQELIDTLSLIIENRPVGEIRDDVERIRIHFYKARKAEIEEEKKQFLSEGGKIEEFKQSADELETQLKDHLDNYRKKKTDHSRVQEGEKQENLKKKYEIIEKIKDLVNREESINKTFQEFRALQSEWHSIGMVPQSALKNMWENYHHNVEVFYNYIKINKELRDLDLKKNLESKVSLCEKAEELLLEPNPVNAFRTLQEFHNQWREIGPVPNESKNEVWERFREATSKINKRHTDYFEKQKEEQRKNFEAKIAICEQVEEVNLMELNSFKDFEEKSRQLIELQKMWRTIGFAPKKHNSKIYQRFRQGCDAFFEKKRAFYSENKEMQMDNLQKKTELCLQAEMLAKSEDWKETTKTLIRLQKEWKEIGPIPRKHADKIWRRFRKACDSFFERKSSHYSDTSSSYDENLKLKRDLIEELNRLDEESDVKGAFESLKDIQRRWAEIGFVPFNLKEEINKSYKDALERQFDRLQLDDEDKNILKYRNKLETVKANPKVARKIRTERDKFYAKIKQLESDITLWENNIGFFAKSKKADSMISEVEEKIESAKKTIRTLEEKIKMIDKSGLDE